MFVFFCLLSCLFLLSIGPLLSAENFWDPLLGEFLLSSKFYRILRKAVKASWVKWCICEIEREKVLSMAT